MLLGPCTFISTLCENQGRCIDDMNMEKGFRCICSSEYEGELCETRKPVINGNSNDLSPSFRSDSNEQQPIGYMLRMGLMFAKSLLGNILLVAIVLVVITLIRLIYLTLMPSADRWKTLPKEYIV